MLDTKHMDGRKVLFRLKHHPSMLSGTVSKVESEGVWIDSPDIVSTMQNDPAWVPMVASVINPVIFVPFASLQFLIASQE